MFEGLKKKLSNFVSSFAKKEEEKVEEEAKEITPQRTEVKHEERRPEAAPQREEAGEKRTETVPKEERRAEHASHEKKSEEGRVAQSPKISAVTKVKGFILGSVKVSENDIDPFIEELKIGLLQSDVNYSVADKIASSIESELVGRSIGSKNIESEIRHAIRQSILSVMAKESSVDIIGMVAMKRQANDLPFKILFIGPNGAGKTTTLAKVAKMLLDNNIQCVVSASDTFRAAAIEQTVHHAKKLGISVIKGSYGSDPASVAFDAIAHAKAHAIPAVLIDSAGRQETNKNLVDELKKITRVTKPDLKIFVGESIAGNALLDQVRALNEAIGLDGIILTKLDVDAKGGNTLSILSETDIPVLYFGIGEGYDDLMPYKADFIADNIMPNA